MGPKFGTHDQIDFSRKHDEGGAFALRECEQSIPRIELPLIGHIEKKIFCQRLSAPLPLRGSIIPPC